MLFRSLRSVILGRDCYVNRGAELYQADVGHFCSIGHFAQIGPNEHLTDEMSTCNALNGASLTIKLDQHNARRTTLGSDVWVGARAILLRGITVGTGAIIAAGAVVTEDVPDYAIVAGVPGRLLRKRFSDTRIAELLQSQWWTLPQTQITQAMEAAALECDADAKATQFLKVFEHARAQT